MDQKGLGPSEVSMSISKHLLTYVVSLRRVGSNRLLNCKSIYIGKEPDSTFQGNCDQNASSDPTVVSAIVDGFKSVGIMHLFERSSELVGDSGCRGVCFLLFNSASSAIKYFTVSRVDTRTVSTYVNSGETSRVLLSSQDSPSQKVFFLCTIDLALPWSR